jgi:hypothetical protein
MKVVELRESQIETAEAQGRLQLADDVVEIIAIDRDRAASGERSAKLLVLATGEIGQDEDAEGEVVRDFQGLRFVVGDDADVYGGSGVRHGRDKLTLILAPAHWFAAAVQRGL